MGLNLSNAEIGLELGLDADSAHGMATQLRNGILAKEPEVVLSGEVVIRMLANVQQVTIEPLMRATIAIGMFG